MENYLSQKNSYDRPVFICGYPKSGTTLLVSLLDGHKDLLVIPEESKFFRKVLPKNPAKRFDTLFQDTGIASIQRGLVDEPSGLRDYRNVDFDLLLSAANEYWENSSKSSKDLLECLVHGISRSTEKNYFLHWVEKTPRTELYLQNITEWWPNSSAIFMMRDPRQTFCSHREYQKKKSKPSKIMIDHFVKKWMESVYTFRKYLESGGRGMIIRYEDLTQEPVRIMKELACFLDISFNDSLLSPTRSGQKWEGNSAGDSQFHRVKAHPDNFLEKLSKDEIDKIEVSLEELMRHYSYDCVIKPTTRVKVLITSALGKVLQN